MNQETPPATTDFAAWIGRTEQSDDPLAATQALAAAALFDLDPAPLCEGAPLPPLWHWFYFLPRAPQALLDEDGHPRRGGFLPPIPYPRRMFAGSRLRFHRPLAIGRPARRHATIRDVATKSGRSGSLAFVTVGLRFEQDGATCIDEEQQIVYREPGAAVPAPPVQPWPDAAPGASVQVVVPDPRQLFRFSALTRFSGPSGLSAVAGRCDPTSTTTARIISYFFRGATDRGKPSASPALLHELSQVEASLTQVMYWYC